MGELSNPLHVVGCELVLVRHQIDPLWIRIWGGGHQLECGLWHHKTMNTGGIDLVQQTLRVRPEVSKNREEAILPLHDDMAALLHCKFAGLTTNDHVFHPVPDMRTYKRDLERAGIDYKDADARFLDFHALRSTFTTRLLRHGVFPSKAICLTRHKSVKTLEEQYDMLGLSDAVDAMGHFPGLGMSCDGGVEPSERGDEQEYPRK